MKTQRANLFLPVVLVLNSFLSACGALATEAPTRTPQPTATKTLVPTKTFTPTVTPRPTRTPNLTATQRYESYNAEIQKYYELGYISTTKGHFNKYDDFEEEWAQLYWYQWWDLQHTARDFVLSAHFKWSNAYRNADESGCGFVFAIQENGEHYAVFLDRSKIVFFGYDAADKYSHDVGLTSGIGRVKFDNPADQPVEADFTIIVTNAYTYVLVNGEVVGEYTLSQSRILKGKLGLSLLSGTNKGYGTRCEMTDIHSWIPD